MYCSLLLGGSGTAAFISSALSDCTLHDATGMTCSNAGVQGQRRIVIGEERRSVTSSEEIYFLGQLLLAAIRLQGAQEN